jgi:pyruvate ferredoxin oxidoreductase gamma subunit
MRAVRFHGRGGQGVVTAAELLAVAAFLDGRHAQAFPTFGSERTGAPVISYCRVDDAPIRAHDPVTRPELVVVQDPTLLGLPAVLEGTAGSLILVNSPREPAACARGAAPPALAAALVEGRVVTLAAGEMAWRHLGRPLPNTALLGALAALSGIVTLESLETAIGRRFPEAAEANAALATEAFRVIGRRAEIGAGVRREALSHA